MIWTVETVKGGETRSVVLNVTGYDLVFPGATTTLYFAFDPTVMKIAKGGKVKITMIGDHECKEWSKTVTNGKTYTKGNRYTATLKIPDETWHYAQAQFRYKITTKETYQEYNILQRDASSISPANLTIDWGDGTENTTIAKDQELTQKTIASHTYVSARNYTITIYSDQPDPANKQIPQIMFADPMTDTGDQCLTSILDPFPNMEATDFTACFCLCTNLTSVPAELFRYNPQATNFNTCFILCRELTSVPAGLFSFNTQATTFKECFAICDKLSSLPSGLFLFNTQATNFQNCFSGCIKLKLRADIFPDPATFPDFFTGKNMNFKNCFNNVGQSAATPGTAPKLWLLNRGGGSWTITDCFTGANVTNSGKIPNDWK